MSAQSRSMQPFAEDSFEDRSTRHYTMNENVVRQPQSTTEQIRASLRQEDVSAYSSSYSLTPDACTYLVKITINMHASWHQNNPKLK